jgi:hypothetical protein
MRNLLLFVLRLAMWPVQRYFERHLVLRLDMGGDAPPPPDYKPVADASKEAAEIAAQLGREQLAEARRQYDQNMAVVRPVVDAQLDVMRQGIQQGADYYEYGKSFRPLEQQMLREAGIGTEGASAAERNAITQQALANAQTLRDRTAAYEQRARSDIDLATGGNAGIVNRFGADIENDVGTALADARAGQTQALNTALRQAMRYGLSVPSNAQALTNQNAAALAAAANNTRNASINNYRNLVAQGVGLNRDAFVTGQAATTDAMSMANQALSNSRNMRVQDQSLDWARKLDVTGMARGMPGASQGAYGMAVGAGNSATQNQMAPGQALIGAMGQANNTTMQGRNLAMQGTLGVLNAQTSYANAVGQSGDSFGSLLGGVGGLLGGLAKTGVFGPSDRRLKENIEAIGRDERTGLTIYEFSYIDDPDMRRYQGVMADEVIAYDPRAVSFDEQGYARVDYARLGIEFKEVV